MNYYQPNSVVNYPSKDVPYTRIVEYKHFLNQKSNDTIIVSEQTNDIGEPYYPVPNKKNLELYEKYKILAKNEEENNIFFVGRLANYKYFNMDETILNSLIFFENVIQKLN
jgi:UDP-galactopyranose mutase